MPRNPSPELVRFLVTRWPLSANSLSHVQQLLAGLSDEDWASFDRLAIERDLAAAVSEYDSGKARVRLPIFCGDRGSKFFRPTDLLLDCATTGMETLRS
jgi:hypothetical protein